MALAWNEACSKEVTPTWLRDIHDQFLATSQTSGGAEAFAFAKAVATVEVACTSEGNAYGCAAAYAFAQSWAQAAAMAHAEAWAQAVQQCECGGKDQITAAEADAFASETFKLTAEVEALAQASVCAGFGSSASDGDAQTCIQDIYAWVYAKVCAPASLGECLVRVESRLGWPIRAARESPHDTVRDGMRTLCPNERHPGGLKTLLHPRRRSQRL